MKLIHSRFGIFTKNSVPQNYLKGLSTVSTHYPSQPEKIDQLFLLFNNFQQKLRTNIQPIQYIL